MPKGKAATLAKRLNDRWKGILRFIDKPKVYEPTNNQGEQTVHLVTLMRRHTQGTRSQWGRK